MQEKNIFNSTLENNNFRTVLFTNEHSQVVLMSIKPGEDIGREVHHVDQILVIIQGHGLAKVAGEEHVVEAHDMIVVPAGAEHNFVNTGEQDMKLFTIYAPAEHRPRTVHVTKADAEADEVDHA
jgi:mannose-6-phosphate isomerase-like protein (cupin superfamily)